MASTPSKARHGYSTTLGIDPAGGTAFTVVAELVDLDGPSLKQTATEVTNLASPSKTKEKITGFVDPGQLKCKCNFTETQYAAFLAMLGKNAMSVQITYPLTGAQTEAATLTGKGQIGEIGQSVPEDDKISMDVTIEATGPWTFAPGTPET